MKTNYNEARALVSSIVALLEETTEDPITFGSRRVRANGSYKVGALGALAVLGYFREGLAGRDLCYIATRNQLERLKKKLQQSAIPT